MTSDGITANQQAAKRISDLEAANADLYEKGAAVESHNLSLTAALNDVNDLLFKQKRETKELEREVAGQNKTIADLNASAVTEKRNLDTARAQIKDFRKGDEEAKRTLANVQRELRQEKQRADTLKTEHDRALTDTDVANKRIDTLERKVALQERDRKAQEFLLSIQKELEKPFADAGTDFTPDNVIRHLRRVSQLADINLNRDVSGDSNSSDPQSSDGKIRRRPGARTASNIAQELDDAEARIGSEDEGSPERLRVPKQRESRDISSSVQTITEQSQTIIDLERQIKKLESDPRLRPTIGGIADRMRFAEKGQVERLQDANKKLEQDITGQVNIQVNKQLAMAENEKISSMRSGSTQTTRPYPSPTPVIYQSNKIRYVDRVRDANILEAFHKSPAWLQCVLGICILLLLWFGISGFRANRMWHAANAHAVEHLRYTQAKRAILGNFRSLLEKFTGYDSQRLG